MIMRISELIARAVGTNFVAEHQCLGCGEALTPNERLLSDGVCPKCGDISQGTICDTTKVAREVK
jgi:predicted RNA-binding Zn-ribbon protein involved in translation (DUF1610 family)